MVTGWKKAKIGELTDIVNGGTPSTAIAEYWNGGINWCTPSDITKKKTKYLSNTEKTITEKGLSESSASLLPIGTILLCSRATIGEMSIAASEMATNQGFKNLICKKDVDNEFLYYALFPLRNRMLELAIGTTFLEISKSALQSIEVIIPADIIEQTAIAGALSDVDSLISSLQKLIEKKKAIKQGAMQELLTGKKRLPGFDEEWRTYKLGELGSFDKGCGISRAESNTGNFPAVRYGELYTKHTDYVKQYYSCISGDVAQTAKRVTFGDILFAASGETKEEIGVCAAIVDRRDIFAGGDIVVFTPTTEINPIFFGTLLNMPFVQKQKSERGQGDAVVHIHADSLSEIIVSIPEKNEQEAIAAVIKDFNDEIEQLEKKLSKYQQIKQGMMQELLTGRIRLVDG
jgi:type I restriction enzyme S subunit